MNKLLSLFVAALALGNVAKANTIVVTSTADAADPAPGTLRYALNNAQDGDVITFDSSLAGQTISIYASPSTAKTDTSLVISNQVEIVGPKGGIILDGGWPYIEGTLTDFGGRIILVQSGVSKVAFRNITFTRGHGRGWNSSKSYYDGGAICANSPVVFVDCDFIRNGACDTTAFGPSGVRGGGAIAATSDVELYNCNMISNIIISGSMSYGGAIVVNGGSLVISNCVLKANKTKSYCGGIYLSNVSKAEFLDSSFSDGSCPGGNGVHAACIWAASSPNTRMIVRRCAFRNNRLGSGFGGAVYLNGMQQLLIDACEFSGCSAGCGGAIRNDSCPTVVVNSTFYGNTSDSWGGQYDVRTLTYFVNCTFVGGYANKENASQNGAAAARVGCNDVYLNTVMTYNYLLSDLYMNHDHGNYGGSTTRCNSIYDATDAAGGALTLATSLSEISSASKLFASYRESNTVPLLDSTKTLSRNVVFPEIEVLKPGTADRPLVVPIEKGGLLDGTGYPVRANADYSYVAYSTDGGTSWTTLFGTDDGTAQLITKDQRGIPYRRGRTPIGAATVYPILGLLIVVR